MAFSIRIYIQVNIILVLTASMAQLGNTQLFKREVRISKFDVNSSNSSIMTVLNSGIKQYHGKHMLYCHFIFHKKMDDAIAKVDVLKCKDYYVDCVNIVSYEVTDICSKKLFDTFFIQTWIPKTSQMCQVGEYRFDNITIATDHFGTFFSFPMEKWWEHYWKFRINIYTNEKIEFFHFYLQFYFLQYRNRSPRH